MSIYYQDDAVTLHHSRWENVLPNLPDGSVDHVITDPPYSDKTHKSVRSRRMSANDRGGRYGADVRRVVNLGFDHLTDEERAAAAVEFARLAQRWILTFSDVETCHLWRDDLEDAGLDYVRTMAWHRLGGAPQFSGDRPGVAFEVITVAHPKGRKRWNSGGKCGHYSHAIVLDRGHEKVRVHATQKPEPLMAEIIGDFTDFGDLILDAYAGSGTTGVVAKRAGRRAILIEQDERSCESIATRLEKVEPVLTEHIEDEALLRTLDIEVDRVTTTPTGVPITRCDLCRRPHSINLRHCDRCGRASTFIMTTGHCLPCAAVTA